MSIPGVSDVLKPQTMALPSRIDITFPEAGKRLGHPLRETGGIKGRILQSAKKTPLPFLWGASTQRSGEKGPRLCCAFVTLGLRALPQSLLHFINSCEAHGTNQIAYRRLKKRREHRVLGEQAIPRPRRQGQSQDGERVRKPRPSHARPGQGSTRPRCNADGPMPPTVGALVTGRADFQPRKPAPRQWEPRDAPGAGPLPEVRTEEAEEGPHLLANVSLLSLLATHKALRVSDDDPEVPSESSERGDITCS